MSYQRMTAVFDYEGVDVPPSELLVLLALAFFENSRTGLCNPSHAAIAARVRLKERQVHRHLQSLRRRGLIAFSDGHGGRHASNHYSITVPINPVMGDTLSGEETLSPVTGLQNETLSPTAETLSPTAETLSPVTGEQGEQGEQGIADRGVGDEQHDLAAPLPRRKLTPSILEALRRKYLDIDVDAELEKYRNHPRKSPPRDQVRAFENWLKNARRFAAERAPRGNGLATLKAGDRDGLADL